MSSGEHQRGYSSLINFNRIAAGLSAIAVAAAVSGCGTDDARIASVPESATPAGLRWGSNGLPGLSFYVEKKDIQNLDCGERYVSAGSWAYNQFVGKDVASNEKDVFSYSETTSLVVCGGLEKESYKIIVSSTKGPSS